ncbi:hypothetical protein ACJMK2_024622 [Sinanodonta woodiana]|uniref:Nucleotide-diphospho-sugar transferase domain-containing protein n=1 Tax=Sinanodonta woodiana TaxID=1069815 RepID=A0ABD3XDY0_SINWO
MFRCSSLIIVLIFACLLIYIYLYNEALEKWKTAVTYRFQLCGKAIISNDNSPTSVCIFKDSSIKTLEQNLSASTTPSFATINFQNILNPWTNNIKKMCQNRTRPLLTLFTTWRESKDKYNVNNITSLNWLSLRPYVVPVVFTNDTSLAVECSRKGWTVFPVSAAAAHGIPILKHMYLDVMKKINSELYAFANSDILFTDTLVETLLQVMEYNSTFKGHTLIIGIRTNVNNITRDEGSSWKELESVSKKRGTLFKMYAEDYFITSGSYPWKDIPDVVIGRRAYDNWLVLNARMMKHRVIDATETILAVHQTTKAGNFEGLNQTDASYNLKLLMNFNKNVSYTAGYTDCAEFITKKDKMNIRITRRLELPKYCKIP